ncbi:hypothetical protein CDL15_Pgr001084 [Punica granatum]|uniref:Uncharacterized protein n=1 Tax=Punica granatum TaxID=22663 RepID=A0A218WKS1_PUNGR|nr:hypothetical protein CDL15_Pgr001084 [Punica granatum]PKI50603.1 hypothetical protein CRG98_028990 [Punica granatum]
MKNNSMVTLSDLSMLTKAAKIEVEVEVVLVALVAEVESAPEIKLALEAELALEAKPRLKVEAKHMASHMIRCGRISSLLVMDKPLAKLSS